MLDKVLKALWGMLIDLSTGKSFRLVFALVLAVTAVSAVRAHGEVKIVAPDGTAGDRFGYSVAISEGTVVVGAWFDDDNGYRSGSAYVFARNQGGADNWGLVKKLIGSDVAREHYFGCDVAIAGDTVVVGASRDNDNGFRSGAVYVFARNQGGADNWGEVKKLTASDGAQHESFGYSVAIFGDTIVVGAAGSPHLPDFPGSAYVLARNQGGADNWGEVKKLTASDGGGRDILGVSVGISEDTIVVGAALDDDNGDDSGSAYVFARNEGGTDNWGEVEKLIASDGAAGDWFGYSVGISGDTVVVGAYRDDDNGDSSGSAYVFERNQGGADNWGEVKKLTASDGAAGDEFGRSVPIAGDTVVVAALGDDDNGDDSGSAYVLARNQGGADNWGEVEKLTASDGAAGDRFGRSVAIAGDTVVVGADRDDDNGDSSGSAYVYSVYLNQPPVADAGGPYSVPEGGSVMLSGSGSDPDGDPLTYAWDLDNDGTFETPGQSVAFLAEGLDGPSSQAVALQVCDDMDACDTSSSEVNITNVAPAVGDITAPTEPVEVDTPVEASASFSDPGTMDTHTATWDWGDSTVDTIDPATSPTSASHAYTEPGVYTVRLTVTDDDGDLGESVFQYVVVYDPEGGFVTGGGWIDSPEGAYTPDPSLTGKATFGFVSKYKRGANVPTGQTEFQFKVANLNFHSDIYDWLVVAGARAQFKGTGTINGEGQYKFMLTALDADINANDSFEVDRFRIRIWEEDEYGTETVVYYDNGLGADHDDDNATTEIGGGSIVIHKEK